MTNALPRTSAIFALALAALVAVIALSGANPLTALTALVTGVFGDRYVMGEALLAAVPLALVGLGVMPALRAGVVTIGSEGQLIIGALMATATVLAFPEAGRFGILLGALAGMAGGILWALVPALLRAHLKVNEILSTLLLNYVAGYLLLMLLNGPMRAATALATPRSERLPREAMLGVMWDGTRLHWGALIVPVLMLLAFLWTRTGRGLVYRLHASHADLAARLGLSEPRAVVTTMLVAGAAAGLAGWAQVAGVTGTLYASVGGGLGFTGILVALLGGLNPFGIVAAAVVFGALRTGAENLQVGTGVPASIAEVIQGALLLALALVVARKRSA